MDPITLFLIVATLAASALFLRWLREMRICNACPGLTATGIYGSTIGVPPIWHGEGGRQ
jgi:hypothetical protein